MVNELELQRVFGDMNVTVTQGPLQEGANQVNLAGLDTNILTSLAEEGLSGAITQYVMAFLVLAIIFGIALYVYYALVWMTIGKKLKYDKAWIAWIPIVNFFLIPILAGKKWPWGFMFLVPIANIVFCIIWHWKIFEKRKNAGWPSLFILIPGGILVYLITLGIIAWYDK